MLNKSSFSNCLLIFFILSLIILFLSQLFTQPFFGFYLTLSPKITNLTGSLKYGMINLAIISGSLFFYLNRKIINIYFSEENDSLVNAKVNNLNKIFTKNLKYNLLLIFVFFVFILIQIFKIYNSGIGTDEGNFLYTTKLIKEGYVLFSDFWSRESGSLIFLIPWFYFFDINIINLRWLVFIVNLLTFSFLYLIIKNFFKNNKYVLFLLSFLIIYSFNGFFDIYQGFFYKISTLLNIIVLYAFYKNIEKKYEFLVNIILGLVCGLSIISYKGSILILITILLLLFLFYKGDYKKIFKRFITFSISSLIPVLMYWLYYSLKTDFYHIFRLVIGDVVIVLFSIIILFSIFIFTKKPKFITNNNFQIFSSNILIFLGYLYLFFKDNTFFNHYYVGLILSSFYLLIFLQLSNISGLKEYKYRKFLISFYLITNICFFIIGFGKENYYLNVSIEMQYLSIISFIIYNLYLYSLLLNESNYEKENEYFIFIPLINVFYILSLISSYIMPSRFNTVSIFTIFFFILIFNSQIIKKNIFIYLLILSGFIGLFTNITSKSSYYLYSLQDYNNVIKIIKYVSNDNEIFSIDATILSGINNKNAFPFSSPYSFGSNMNYNFLYDNIDKKYPNKQISFIKKNLFDELKEKKPEVLVITDKLPFRPYNYKYPEGLNYLNSYYYNIYKSSDIWIFIKK